MSFDLDPCRVHADSGELLAEGFVREHEDDRLVVEAENFSGRWLEPGDPAVVQVMSALRGQCTYDATVAWAAAGRVELHGLRLQASVQQRAAVRVPTAIAVPVTHVVRDGVPESLEEPIQVVVVDISAHGVRLMSADPIEPETRLRLRLPVATPPLDLMVRVLRHTEAPRGWAHGCRFDRISERDEDVLFRFVLSEQRRRRAQHLDMA
ncbi:flagellar brake protein [Cellulomonas bogoriensis]|uniref:PilZ domain-containing protein n=1 Tax=Cellulomonas bogoriensis 69B4 = DSM 16987 TaxID=1386082 RepID=A0A0A0BZP0_9CELL|nr:PilZ domain-containing protein [Cellulomonas bogoriensis]KGM13410.1 hypothetical protein N869_14280 [Cellulomonas bogoriensis 69B4 = DSM 16987]